MILEKETYEEFGYSPLDLKPQSNKKIVAVCDNCGEVRVSKKQSYRSLCLGCSRKGEKSPVWKGGKVKRICEFCGTEFPLFPSQIKNGRGKFCSTSCAGKSHKGENGLNWQGGLSFEPYCHKFNNEFKEYIRDKFGRVCFLCPTTEVENGQRLSVHHVNYNKKCGCDDDETCQFVPLCRSCNSKVNTNREMWETKIKQKMQNKLNGWYI